MTSVKSKVVKTECAYLAGVTPRGTYSARLYASMQALMAKFFVVFRSDGSVSVLSSA